MDNVQPKRIGRPPKDGEARMVQTALRMPIDLFKFYHEFDDPADHMRRALERYQDRDEFKNRPKIF